MPIAVQVMMFCVIAFICLRTWANTEWLIWQREHELSSLEGSEKSDARLSQIQYEREFSYMKKIIIALILCFFAAPIHWVYANFLT